MNSKELTELLKELDPIDGDIVILSTRNPDPKYKKLINSIDRMNEELRNNLEEIRRIMAESYYSASKTHLT